MSLSVKQIYKLFSSEKYDLKGVTVKVKLPTGETFDIESIELDAAEHTAFVIVANDETTEEDSE